MKAVDHEVPVSDYGYLDLGRTLFERIQERQRKSEFHTWQLATQEAKIGEMELKVLLLTNHSILLWGLKKKVPAQDTQITILEVSSGNMNKSLALMTPIHSAMQTELSSARAAISLKESAIQYFAKKGCTGYWSSPCAVY